MIFVMGGSGSGKSAFAEQLLVRTGCAHRYYLATMQVYDDEGEKKVERHRRLRAGKGFVTIEQPRDVRRAAAHMAGEDSAALLECMSNLVANEMFQENMADEEASVAGRVISDVEYLSARLTSLIVVSNNIFEDGICYDADTMRYLRALGRVNRRLAALADQVYEVVVGIGVRLKG